MKSKLLAFAILFSGTAACSFAQDAASTPFHGSPPPVAEPAPPSPPRETPAPPPEIKAIPKPSATVAEKQKQPSPATPPPPTPPPATPRPPAETPPPESAVRAPVRKPTPKPQEKPEREDSSERNDDAGGVAGVIKAFEKEWEASIVKHDSSVIERLVADDFIGVSSSGKIGDKLTLLYEAKRDKNVYKTASARQLSVHTFGSHVAVVLGVTREGGTDSAGRPFDHTYRFTDTWMERGGKWQCIAAHAAVATRR